MQANRPVIILPLFYGGIAVILTYNSNNYKILKTTYHDVLRFVESDLEI